jgi:hypothetical protein
LECSGARSQAGPADTQYLRNGILEKRKSKLSILNQQVMPILREGEQPKVVSYAHAPMEIRFEAFCSIE